MTTTNACGSVGTPARMAIVNGNSTKQPLASVARIVKESGKRLTVGVPDRSPAEERVNPGGIDDPAVLVNTIVPDPPDAVICWLYATPTAPSGRVDGDNVMTGQPGAGGVPKTMNTVYERWAKHPLVSVPRIKNVCGTSIVGVPDSTPPLDRERPAGNVPGTTVNTGVPVAPVRVNVWL